MRKSSKIFFLFFSVYFLFGQTALVLGAEQKIDPAFNPICWQEPQCTEARAKIMVSDPSTASKGFIPEEPPCDKKDWGKCLPAGKSTASISFGGKKEFTDIGEYIKTVYNYALSIASIVAVIMIIVAGFQWISSGGNSDTISGAKKRITGALVGLLIAYMSFIILNTINPSLVNLRLPQVYMIRPFKTTPEFCDGLPAGTKFSLAAKAKEQSVKVEPASDINFDLPYPADATNSSTFLCGERYFIENAGNAICGGDICPSGEVCINFPSSNVDNNFDKQNPYHCAKGTVAGYISYNVMRTNSPVDCVLFEGWEYPDITDEDEQELWIACTNKRYEVSASAKTVTGEKSQTYFISASTASIDTAVQNCGGEGNVRGFYLKFEMNEECDPKDENHWIGKDGKDLGDDGFFNSNFNNIKKEYFIPLSQIRQGISLNIDATIIYDIDEDSERSKYQDLLSN